MSKKKKNKQDNTMLWILLIILFVCFVMIAFLFYKYFYSGISTSKYGDTRLEGIENYPLSSTLENDIKELYSDNKSVGDVKINIKGKIIYVNIDFKEAVKVDAAKSAASKALEKIGEDNLKFYEVQFVLTYSGETENTNFPIFGSKNSNSLKVVW